MRHILFCTRVLSISLLVVSACSVNAMYQTGGSHTIDVYTTPFINGLTQGTASQQQLEALVQQMVQQFPYDQARQEHHAINSCYQMLREAIAQGRFAQQPIVMPTGPQVPAQVLPARAPAPAPAAVPVVDESAADARPAACAVSQEENARLVQRERQYYNEMMRQGAEQTRALEALRVQCQADKAELCQLRERARQVSQDRLLEQNALQAARQSLAALEPQINGLREQLESARRAQQAAEAGRQAEHDRAEAAERERQLQNECDQAVVAARAQGEVEAARAQQVNANELERLQRANASLQQENQAMQERVRNFDRQAAGLVGLNVQVEQITEDLAVARREKHQAETDFANYQRAHPAVEAGDATHVLQQEVQRLQAERAQLNQRIEDQENMVESLGQANAHLRLRIPAQEMTESESSSDSGSSSSEEEENEDGSDADADEELELSEESDSGGAPN